MVDIKWITVTASLRGPHNGRSNDDIDRLFAQVPHLTKVGIERDEYDFVYFSFRRFETDGDLDHPESLASQTLHALAKWLEVLGRMADATHGSAVVSWYGVEVALLWDRVERGFRSLGEYASFAPGTTIEEVRAAMGDDETVKDLESKGYFIGGAVAVEPKSTPHKITFTTINSLGELLERLTTKGPNLDAAQEGRRVRTPEGDEGFIVEVQDLAGNKMVRVRWDKDPEGDGQFFDFADLVLL